MGWLHSPIKTGTGDNERLLSRYDYLSTHKSKLVDMPPVKSGQYLLDCWLEIGLNGSDNNQVSWAEINAFIKATNTPLNSKECSIIRLLSREYCNSYNESGYNIDYQAPYISDRAKKAIEKAKKARERSK